MTTEKRVELITQLTAGLLASGHFSSLDEEGDVTVMLFDNGKTWKEDGAPRRFETEAVVRAETLLGEIIDLCEEKSPTVNTE